MCFTPQPRAFFRHRRTAIQSSKSGPRPTCFDTFDFQMCVAPQRRALFRHLNFQKYPKVLWSLGVLYMFTSKCASHCNGVRCFDISTSKSRPNPRCFVPFDFEMCFAPQQLASYLRTRRFREPTFRPSSASKHWKNTVFRDFPTFSRACTFSLLTFSSSYLLPSDFLHVRVSSWLCFFLAVLFISPYCRKFHF